MSKPNPNIFREYDIRGVVAEDLPSDVVVTARQGHRHVPAPQGREALHHRARRADHQRTDRQRSEGRPGLHRPRNHAMSACARRRCCIFRRRICRWTAAIMITGSHNPPEFNGIKMALRQDRDLRRADPGNPPPDRSRRLREGLGRAGEDVCDSRSLRRVALAPTSNSTARCASRMDSRQRRGRAGGAADLPRAGRDGLRSLQRGGRPLPQPSSRSDRGEEPRRSEEDSWPRRAWKWAWVSTATPTGWARLTRTAR